MTHLRKLLQTLLILTLAFTVFTKPTMAQTSSSFVEALTSPGANLQKMIGGDSLVKGYQKGSPGILTSLIPSINIYLTGYIDPITGEHKMANSAVMQLASATTALYQPSTSSTQYLAYIKQKISSPTAYAAPLPTGKDVISPVITLWESMRNLSYVFFVIVFVVFGFMIMFRSKLNPQTTINIQLALPKIVIGLILVTFSFAILSFIVDLAFLGNALASKTIGSSITSFGYTWKDFENPDGLGFVGDFLTTYGEGPDAAQNILRGGLPGAFTKILTSLVNAFSAPESLILLIIGFTLLGAVFKIFFALLAKHVIILLSVIVSPIVLTFSSLSFNSSPVQFLKSFLSACLVFPATTIALNLAAFFAQSNITISGISTTIAPFTIGEIDGIHADNIIKSLIGLGILMFTSTLPEIIDNALGLKQGAFSAGTQELKRSLSKVPLIGGLGG